MSCVAVFGHCKSFSAMFVYGTNLSWNFWPCAMSNITCAPLIARQCAPFSWELTGSMVARTRHHLNWVRWSTFWGSSDSHDVVVKQRNSWLRLGVQQVWESMLDCWWTFPIVSEVIVYERTNGHDSYALRSLNWQVSLYLIYLFSSL